MKTLGRHRGVVTTTGTTGFDWRRPAIAAVLLCMAAGGASAQDAANSDSVLDEIVVTAQKREQLAQDIPVSLYAVDGESLASAGIGNLNDIDQIAAGITISEGNPDQFNVSMRGISNLGGNFIAGPATGLYIDETPISALTSAVPQLAFWDAERIEVLRGPQGTLFGEGSMGGTVRLITAKPDASEFSGRVQAGYSSVDSGDSGYSAKGMLNIPLAEDVLALRVTAAKTDIIGWVDVPDLNATDANDGDQTSYRVALRWTPTDKMALDFAYENQEIEINNDFFATSPGVYNPSDLLAAFDSVQFLTERDSDYDLMSLTLNYDLGWASLVGAVSRFESNFATVADRSYVLPVFFGVPGTAAAPFYLNIDAGTEELRLVSNGEGRFDWTIGAYHKKDDRDNPDSGFIFNIPALEPILGTAIDEALTTQTSSNDAFALFADVEYRITDNFAIQAGIRRYEADYDQLISFDTTSLLLGTVAGTVDGSGSSDATTAKFGLSWTPADEVLIYAKYSEGFRDGGVNPNAQPARPEIPSVYDPEEIDAVELGIKTRPTDWLQANASIYQNTWTNLQLGFVTSDGLLGYTANAGKAKADGAEIELIAAPLDNLQLGLNVAYVDSVIDEEVQNAFGQVIATKGNKVPFSPEYQFAFTTSYTFALTDSLQGSLALNYSYRDDTFSEPENRDTERNESFKNLFLQAGVGGERWNANVYVQNATDSEVTNIRSRFVTALPYVFGSYVQPRTVGVEFNLNF